MNTKRELKRKIHALDFAIHELVLFLDTHPTNRKAMELLKEYRMKRKECIELYEQKTKKFKKFPITSSYKADLEDFIVGKDDEEWLFASRRGGKPITRIQAYRIIQDACFEAGITDKIGTHTLRKTFGYHFYQEHKDIGLLQYIFNHSSQQVTLLYIGITQDIVDSKLRSFAL